MQKKVRVCDFCKDRENIALRTCTYCNKDLCVRHTKALSISLYGSRYGEDTESIATTLKISIGYTHPNSTLVHICPECEKIIKNILTILSQGDKEYILKELIEFMKIKAEVEAL